MTAYLQEVLIKKLEDQLAASALAEKGLKETVQQLEARLAQHERGQAEPGQEAGARLRATARGQVRARSAADAMQSDGLTRVCVCLGTC